MAVISSSGSGLRVIRNSWRTRSTATVRTRGEPRGIDLTASDGAIDDLGERVVVPLAQDDPPDVGERAARLLEVRGDQHAHHRHERTACGVEAAQQFDHVAAQTPGVGCGHRILLQGEAEDRLCQRLTVGPAPVDHRATGAGALSDGVDGEGPVATLGELFPTGRQDGLLQGSPATSADTVLKIHLCILPPRRTLHIRYDNVS